MKTNETELRMKNEELAKLVAKARSGDQTAFTELYDRTSSDLFRCIRAMTRDEDLTWDIQQDSYLRAFQNLDQLEVGEAFFPWLRRIAVNVTANRMKQRLPLTFTELSSDEDDGMPELPDPKETNQPELSLDRKETARLVKEILSQLPEAQQLIVGMRYYDELSVKEIAELLKLSDGTVKAQLFHGRKKVEAAVRALEKQGIKLYGLSPIAFLTALLRRMEPAEDAARATMQSVAAKAGIAAGTKAAASAAAPVVLQATKPFFSTTLGKLVLGVAAAAVVVGGAAGYRWARNNLFEKTAPILMVDSSEDLQNDPTAPTVPVEVDVTGPTLPITRDDTAEDLVTEPVVSEPTVTEPSATEPAETEPVGTDPAATEPSGAEPAQPVRADNQCGEHLTWSFDYKAGGLTVKGSGPMDDYASAEDAPWHAYQSEITGVEFPEGMTSVGDYAFAGCTALEYARLDSKQLCRIGAHAFDGCTIGSFSLYNYYSNSTNDRAPLEIGDYAFRGCEGISVIVCPENVTRIGEGAFADCSSLKTIWILNRDCAFGAEIADSSVELCGLPDSGAARYAEENACAFSPMTENRDEIVDLLEKTYLHYEGIIPLDSRYLLRVFRHKRVTATEEEIRQAGQTGAIVLNGVEYAYTESSAQAEEWAGERNWQNRYEPDDTEAWVCDANTGSVYNVVRMDDNYQFIAIWYFESPDYIEDIQPVGWLWLDADTPYDDVGTMITVGECNNFYVFMRNQKPCLLRLSDAGEIIPMWNSSGRR